MIDRNGYGGDINFVCDICDDTCETGTSEFSEAISYLKSEGWQNKSSNGGWNHHCPACLKEGLQFKPFAKVEENAVRPMEEFAPLPVQHDIVLGEQQATAAAMILAWRRDPEAEQVFTLAGYAGTGKTTLAKYISAELGNQVVFAAFTGKAVNILNEKGCPNVSTIHALLYKPVNVDKTKLNELQLELEMAQGSQNNFLTASLQSDIAAVRKEMRKPKFELNTESVGGELIIVDEYSMLPNEIITDLLRKFKKVLFMGDPFQLPPVKGNCNLQPNFFLTEIHRQALESAIVRLSVDIRNGQSFPFGDYGDLVYMPACQATPDIYMGVEQIIVGRNATRNAINHWYRQQKGITSFLPVAGDKMICLKNERKLGIFNGMICTAIQDAIKAKDYYNNYMLKTDIELPIGEEVLSVWDGDVMGKGEEYDWNDWSMKSLKRFDYAYAITCHKSQGSEFKTCLVYNEPVGNDDLMKRRWLYTAITRGKEKVWLVQP